MNLEAIEQKCLSYLKQVSNPLVPVENLMNHLRADEDCPEFNEQQFIEFLRDHELIMLVEPPHADEAPEVAEELGSMGIPVGPRVILTTRLPTKEELAGMVARSLQRMTNALAGAMNEARETGDTESEDEVLDILARAERLKRMTREAFEDDAES